MTDCVGLATYGTTGDTETSELVAATVWSEATYRLWPTTAWPTQPTDPQIKAIPWLDTFEPDPQFQKTIEGTVADVSAQIERINEADGIVGVWNAPITLGLLYDTETPLTLPNNLVDLRVLDRHFNHVRAGRRTLATTTDWYGTATGDLSPFRDAHHLSTTTRALLDHHDLTPGPNLHHLQQKLHREQTEQLARWMVAKRKAEGFHLDHGWPVRNDQRMWHASLALEDWMTQANPPPQVRAAINVLLQLAGEQIQL